MKNNVRKSISVLLSVLMVLSLFGGLTAIAADASDLAAALEEANYWYDVIDDTSFGYNHEELLNEVQDAITTGNAVDPNGYEQMELEAAVSYLQNATANLVLAYGYDQATRFYSYIEYDYPEIAATLNTAVDAATAVVNDPDATAAEKLAAGKAVYLAQNVAAFEVEKAEAIEWLQNRLQPTDSEACRQIVSDAVAEIAALAYDESKDYFENRNAVSSLERAASDALEAQRAADIDANTEWALIPTSAEGLEDGTLYLNLGVFENNYAAQYVKQEIFNLIPANNYGAAGIEALKKQYPALWQAAYEQEYADEHMTEYDLDGMTMEEYFAPDRFGGIFIETANDIFFEALKTERPDLFVESPWGGVSLDYDQLEEIGTAYVQDFYANEYAQAEVLGRAQAQAETDELRSYDWYIDTNGYSRVKAVKGDVALDDVIVLSEVISTLDEVGLVWKDVKVVDDTSGLENGDYYLLQSAIDDLFTGPYAGYADMFTGFLFFVNPKATDDSLFRFKLTFDETSFDKVVKLPFEEFMGLRIPYDTAFLKTNVQLYHPEHVFGDWAADDADYHSCTCTICGEVKTEAHDVIVKGAGEANCGHDGYTGDEVCSVCNATLSAGTIIPATGDHTVTLVNAKEATATEDGYTGDEVCTVCGKTIKTGEAIPAAGGDMPDEPGDGGDCPFCGKYHAKLWVRIVHLVLWLFQNLFRVFE